MVPTNYKPSTTNNGNLPVAIFGKSYGRISIDSFPLNSIRRGKYPFFPLRAMATLLLAAHGTLLRLLAAEAGEHFQGLAVAARRSTLSAPLKRKLVNIDVAFNLLRHITEPSVDAFVAEVRDALHGSSRTSLASTPPTGCGTTALASSPPLAASTPLSSPTRPTPTLTQTLASAPRPSATTRSRPPALRKRPPLLGAGGGKTPTRVSEDLGGLTGQGPPSQSSRTQGKPKDAEPLVTHFAGGGKTPH